MFTERRPLGLKITISLALINSLATLVHFILLGRHILQPTGLVTNNLWIYAIAVTVTAVIPTALGAYGLWYRRMWGLGLFTLGSGGYLYSVLYILLLSVQAKTFGVMFAISIYLTFYIILSNTYSWMLRHHLRDY